VTGIATDMTATTDSRPYAKALERLKTVGLRPTRQRLALAKLLFDGDDRHVSAEQLHAEAVAADMRVSLATVYNALHQFTTVGLLREVVVESGRAYFDTNTGNHHHFYHVDEGKLVDIDQSRLSVAALPEPPEGTAVDRVDVIIRLRNGSGSAQS